MQMTYFNMGKQNLGPHFNWGDSKDDESEHSSPRLKCALSDEFHIGKIQQFCQSWLVSSGPGYLVSLFNCGHAR